MNYYDLTFLINPTLPGEKAKEVADQMLSFLQQEGALLDKIGSPVSIPLAYPIEKQVSAYLAFLTFFGKTDKIAALKEKLSQEKSILRFLIAQQKRGRQTKISPTLRAPSPFPRKPEEKVEIGEIEKKLEEILGE